ncbi:glycosyltransferase family 2 protein, partial [Bacillus subtilis]|uniref:glycosyltransferase family 2 protein n=1 Tax=Bacillus subtilis TaxID=1423 RepID=UPI003C206096
AKVSVIMPVYNSEKYILETLKSLIIQSAYIHELIIINDSSTDASCEIIRNFVSEYDNYKIIKLLNNKFEKGIAGSLNTGLTYSSGEYIA